LVTPEAEIGGYGTVGAVAIGAHGADFLAHTVVEKPSVDVARASLHTSGLASGNYLTWFGIHAVTNAIFDVLAEDIREGRRDRGEYQFTGAQGRLVEREGYAVTIIDGDRHDTGNPSAWRSAMAALGSTVGA
jgi:UTP--glucose-1-phosphate uridylyltransferase